MSRWKPGDLDEIVREAVEPEIEAELGLLGCHPAQVIGRLAASVEELRAEVAARVRVAQPSPAQAEAFARLPRELAEQDIKARLDRLKGQIRALPLAEKLRFAADAIELGARVAPSIPLAVVRLALSELEGRP